MTFRLIALTITVVVGSYVALAHRSFEMILSVVLVAVWFNLIALLLDKRRQSSRLYESLGVRGQFLIGRGSGGIDAHGKETYRKL